MARQSFIKRILSLGRVDDEPEHAASGAAVSVGPDLSASVTGEAVLRPSITEMLFRRRNPAEDDARPQESGESRALVADRLVEKPMSRKEETAQKISEGFDSLSGLLKSINEKLDTGNERGRVLADSIEELPEVLRSIPETNRAQIEFLGTISKQLDLGNARSGELMEQFRSLPEILRNIPESQRQTAEQLREIATLLSEGTGKQLDWMRTAQEGQQAALNTFQSAQNKSLNLFHKAQQQGLSMVRGAQQEQSRQIQEFLVSSQKSMSRVLIACAGIVGAAVIAVAAMYFLN